MLSNKFLFYQNLGKKTVILFLLLNYLCAGFSLLHGLPSSSYEWGLLSSCHGQASHFSGFSSCRAQAPGSCASVAVAHEISSCSSQALEHNLNSYVTRA